VELPLTREVVRHQVQVLDGRQRAVRGRQRACMCRAAASDARALRVTVPRPVRRRKCSSKEPAP